MLLGAKNKDPEESTCMYSCPIEYSSRLQTMLRSQREHPWHSYGCVGGESQANFTADSLNTEVLRMDSSLNSLFALILGRDIIFVDWSNFVDLQDRNGLFRGPAVLGKTILIRICDTLFKQNLST